MSYKPFTTEYTYQIIDVIKEYLEETNKDQTTLDTLDLCHLIGEIERLNNIINECAEDILKELEENHHLSCGVALGIRQKLLDYKELKGNDK